MENKNLKIWAIRIGLLFLPTFFAFAQTLPSNILETVMAILKAIVSILFIVMTIYFIWGIVLMLVGAGRPEAAANGWRHIWTGLIGMIVALACWGIVDYVINYLGISKEPIPTNLGE